MKKSIIVLWIATLVVIVFIGLSQRYTIKTVGSGYGYKLDRLTGNVWFLMSYEERKLVTKKKSRD